MFSVWDGAGAHLCQVTTLKHRAQPFYFKEQRQGDHEPC